MLGCGVCDAVWAICGLWDTVRLAARLGLAHGTRKCSWFCCFVWSIICRTLSYLCRLRINCSGFWRAVLVQRLDRAAHRMLAGCWVWRAVCVWRAVGKQPMKADKKNHTKTKPLQVSVLLVTNHPIIHFCLSEVIKAAYLCWVAVVVGLLCKTVVPLILDWLLLHVWTSVLGAGERFWWARIKAL